MPTVESKRELVGATELGGIVVFFSALGVASSVVYDFFYFQAMGISLASVPLQLTDHIKRSFSWLPFAVPLLLYFIATNHVGGAYEERKDASKIMSDWILGQRWRFFSLFLLIVLLTLAFGLNAIRWYLIIGTLLWWPAFSHRIEPFLDGNFSGLAKNLLVSSFTLLLLSATWGLFSGLQFESNFVEAEICDREMNSIQVNVVATLESGLLFHDQSAAPSIQFITWGDLKCFSTFPHESYEWMKGGLVGYWIEQ